MTKVEALENEMKSLNAEELSDLLERFAEYEAAQWDEQIRADNEAGKLDALMEAALAEHAQGKSVLL